MIRIIRNGATVECDTVAEAVAFINATRPVTDDGWIEWNGGKNPAGVSKVEYRLRDGATKNRPAGYLRWEHSGAPYDIVAYRIVS